MCIFIDLNKFPKKCLLPTIYNREFHQGFGIAERVNNCCSGTYLLNRKEIVYEESENCSWWNSYK